MMPTVLLLKKTRSPAEGVYSSGAANLSMDAQALAMELAPVLYGVREELEPA